MMHPVKNTVSPGAEIGRALNKIRKDIEEPLPELTHGESSVCGIPMLKKRLCKK